MGEDRVRDEEERTGDEGAEPTPGTRLLKDRRRGAAPGAFKTILVSSSAKARAKIRKCEECGHDNVPEAVYCEGCGSNLDDQEKKKEFEESMRRLDEYTEKVAGARSKREGGTILRRRKAPVMQPAADVEKKSYHSQYMPGGADRVQQYDQSGFRSDVAAPVRQGYGPPAYQQPGAVQPVMPQYVAVPVNYAVPAQPKTRSTAFIVGVVLLAFLAVVLIGLVITIVILV